MKRIVVTLSRGALSELPGALGDPEVLVEWRPLIAIEPPDDPTRFDDVMDRLADYGSVAFTSPRATRAFAERLGQPGWTSASKPELWAAGQASAAPLVDVGLMFRTPSGGQVATHGAAVAMAREMIETGAKSPILHLCGETRRPELRALLTAAGMVVDEVECYRAVPAGTDALLKAAHAADVLVVGSPMVAEALARATVGLRRPRVLALGPTTAAASEAAGWKPARTAGSPKIEGVAEAIRSMLTNGDAE